MKTSVPFLLVCFLGSLATAAAETRFPIGTEKLLWPLAWLEGTWLGDFEGNQFEAHYTSPEGGVILSMNKEFLKDGRCWIEFERFTVSGDSVILTPYPQGEKSVNFVLTGFERSVKKAVFVNEAHDFPSDITYEAITPDSLRILVAGPGKDGRKVLTVNLARQK